MIGRGPAPAPRAKTMMKSAAPALLMKCLTPVRWIMPSASTARVVISAGLDPAPGSVRAKAPSAFPAAASRR